MVQDQILGEIVKNIMFVLLIALLSSGVLFFMGIPPHFSIICSAIVASLFIEKRKVEE